MICRSRLPRRKTKIERLDRLAIRGRAFLLAANPSRCTAEAVHETLEALRGGTAPASIKSVASPDLMKQVTRQADYSKWSRDFLDAGFSGG